MASWVAMSPVKGRDVDQAELRLRLSASLDEARTQLIDATERGEGGRAALARHAECIDGIIRELVESARTHTQAPLAVCAVGGYGRKSQFLHSDIDLLVRVRRTDRPARGALRQERCCIRCGICGSRSGITCGSSPISIASTRRIPNICWR